MSPDLTFSRSDFIEFGCRHIQTYPSRFNPPPQMYPPNMIPMHPGPGAGYQPPFPQPRMPTSGVAFHPAFHGPDWFNVFDSNIYGSGKIDINIIVRIVSADKKLRHLVQG